MNRFYTLLALAALLVALAAPSFAQVAISAKAGMVHVADGEVYLAGKQIEMQPSSFPEIKEGQILSTGEGRVEVLLAPGTFLRMSEAGAFKMLNNRISDTRILLEKGSVLIEAMDLLDGNYMTIAVGDVVVNPQKEGLYQIDVNPLRVRAYTGDVRVSGGGQAIIVKAGRELVPNGTQWALAKYDENDTNSLYRWARRRSESLAKANVTAARTAGTGMTYGFSRGTWVYNNWLGMMTFLPYGSTYRSAFGYSFYTPWTVMTYYAPPPAFNGGGFGGSGGFERSIGGSYSGGFAGGGAPIRSAGGGYSGSTGGGSMGGSMGGGSSAGASAGAAAPARGGESSGGGGGRGGSGGGGRQ